ncbi:reverse transcriptase domain-containing protein [Tanacetum coccineum]
MLVEVGKFTFPANFVILEMEEESKVPLILGRPFLHTADAVIRVKQKQLNLRIGTERMIFNIDSAMKHSYSNDDTCFSINVIDEILEEDFDALTRRRSEILHYIEIADRPWVSPIRLIPEKGGITVVTNENNELVPTRTVTDAKLSLETFKPTKMSVRLADKSFQYRVGIAENMLVKVGKFTFPTNFVILEMEKDSKVPLILGRPFLHTADAVIRVKQKQLNLRIGTKRMIFNIDSAMKHSYFNDDICFSINVIDEILEEDFDALLDESSILSKEPFSKKKSFPNSMNSWQ